MNNALRSELLAQTKKAQQLGFKGSIMDVLSNPMVLQEFTQQQNRSRVEVASTPKQQQQGLSGVPANQMPEAMVFPNVKPNTSFNTKDMLASINIQKYDEQGHLVKSYENVPPGITNLPMGPQGGTVIETPANVAQSGGRKKYQSGSPTEYFEQKPLTSSDFDYTTDRSRGNARYFSDPITGEPFPLVNLPEAEVAAQRTPYNQLSNQSLLAGVTQAKPWFEAGNYKMGYKVLKEREEDLQRANLINEFTGIPAMGRTADRIKNDPADLFTFEGGLDALSFIPSGILASRGTKALARQASPLVQDAGKFLTTQTPLKNTYKYNPWAFKPNPEAYYRGVGNEGIKDALETGVIKSRDTDLFPAPYFAKPGEFETALYYNPEALIEAKGIDVSKVKNIQPDELIFRSKDAGAVPLNHQYVDELYLGNVSPGFKQSNLENIPISNPNIRLLQKDWLRGYKPINTPKQLPGSGNTFKSEIDWRNWVKYKEDFDNNPDVVQNLLDIERRTKADGTWMKNADGSTFQGTPEEFVIQQSDRFKKAYGNGADIVYRGGDPSPTLEHYKESSKGQDPFSKTKFTFGDPRGAAKWTPGLSESTFSMPKENLPDQFLSLYSPKTSKKLTLNTIDPYYKDPTTYSRIDIRHQEPSQILEDFKLFMQKNYPIEKYKDQGDLTKDWLHTDQFAHFLETRPDLDRIEFSKIFDGTINAYPVNIHQQKPGNFLKSTRGNILLDLNNRDVYRALVPTVIGAGATAAVAGSEPKQIIPPDFKYGGPVKYQNGGPTNPPYTAQRSSTAVKEPVIQGQRPYETLANPSLIGIMPKDQGEIKQSSPGALSGGPSLSEIVTYGPGQRPGYMQSRNLPENYYEPLGENVAEFFDPTGVLSHDDAGASFDSWKKSGRPTPTFEESLNMASALPAIGKFKILGRMAYQPKLFDFLQGSWNNFITTAGAAKKLDNVTDVGETMQQFLEYVDKKNLVQKAYGGPISYQNGGLPGEFMYKSQSAAAPLAYNSPTANGYLLPDPNRPELMNTGATEYKMGVDDVTIPTVVNGNYMDPETAYQRYKLTGEKFKPTADPSAYSKFYDEVNKLGIMKYRKGGKKPKYKTPKMY